MFVNSIVIGAATIAGFVLAAGPFGAAGVAAVRTLVAGMLGTTAGLWWLRRLARAGALATKLGEDRGARPPAPLVAPPEGDVLVASGTG
jgi:hypothetical protein